jgi:hypothetical protein
MQFANDDAGEAAFVALAAAIAELRATRFWRSNVSANPLEWRYADVARLRSHRHNLRLAWSRHVAETGGAGVAVAAAASAAAAAAGGRHWHRRRRSAEWIAGAPRACELWTCVAESIRDHWREGGGVGADASRTFPERNTLAFRDIPGRGPAARGTTRAIMIHRDVSAAHVLSTRLLALLGLVRLPPDRRHAGHDPPSLQQEEAANPPTSTLAWPGADADNAFLLPTNDARVRVRIDAIGLLSWDPRRHTQA